MSPAGDRIYRILAKWLSDRAIHDVVAPTIADLQYEVLEAGPHRLRRWTARCRGYGALLRALLLHRVSNGIPIQSAASILVIGIAGGALYGWTRGTVKDPRIIQSALLLPMCAAPIALRLGGSGMSYRRTFAGLVAVGLLMWMVSGGFVQTSFRSLWMNRAAATSFNLAVVATLSALGAAAVWAPPSGTVPMVRRIVLGVLASAVVTTSTYFAGVWLSGGQPEHAWIVTLPFYAAMFAVPIALTSLPLLLVAHRWIRTHVGLALFGGVLSPVAMMVVLYLDLGSASAVINCLRDMPATSALMTLPFVFGNGVLAWSLSARAVAPRTR
jgi:hypothetical protein